MRESAGRVIFFDALADSLLGLVPGPVPKRIALRMETGGDGLQPVDQVALAEATCRLSMGSSSHISVRHAHELGAMDNAEGVVVLAGNLHTADVLEAMGDASTSAVAAVITGYARNNAPGLVELPFDLESDRDLVEYAVRVLFEAVGADYEPLAPSRFRRGGFAALTKFDLFEDARTRDLNDPLDIERFSQTVSQSWSYQGNPVDGAKVYDWVMQFHAAGFGTEACQLLLYLKREGFVSLRAVVNSLVSLYTEHTKALGDAPPVLSIQPPGKSEGLLAYSLFPHTAFVSIESALDDAKQPDGMVEWVCFDDVIGSGGSMLSYLFDPQENKHAKAMIRAFETKAARLTVFAAYADERGMAAISEDPRGWGAVRVSAGTVMDHSRCVFSPETVILTERSRLQEFKEFCEARGEEINPGNPLGWTPAEWCLIFDYTVPNATLPVFWASSRRSRWCPLFPRDRRPPRRRATKG